MDAQEWLKTLIGFNTVSSNSNTELIKAINEWFKSHDINTHILYGSSEGLKANLFATIPARNGQIQGGLLLSAHTDVVPVLGQNWDSDPFIAVEKDGKIFGRGSSDMKGFIAVMLDLVPELKKMNLRKPIHFSFSYDEEVGCIGVDYVVEHLKKMGIYPEGCIVGEPSCLRPIIGEKGRIVYHCQIQGLAAHSSIPNRGCNAIEYAGKLINYIRKLADNIKIHGPFDDDFDLPFTTITTNIISGGSASNIIPGMCEFIFEIRPLPEYPVENILKKIEHYINANLLPEMKKSYSNAAIYLDKISDVSGFYALEDALITKLLRKMTGVTERLKVSYTTEAGIFQDAGIPAVIWGPGDIEQAHRTNEFIVIDQLHKCKHTLREIINAFCVN